MPHLVDLSSSFPSGSTITSHLIYKQLGLERTYVYDCCGATMTSLHLNPLASYVKEILPSTKKTVTELWVIEFFS
jgi:hypothetical protein